MKDSVPAMGNFHGCGHMAFAINEGFHDVKLMNSKLVLHVEKVPKHIPNFENDSYKHVTALLRADYVGTLASVRA